MAQVLADRYRNDPYNPLGYVALHEPAKFTTLHFTDFYRRDAITPAGTPVAVSAPNTPPGTPHHRAMQAQENCVELCIGQVPFFLDEDTIASFLSCFAPEARIRRCVIAESSMGRRRGLCFVLLSDNGAAQKLLQLHQRVWFTEDHKSVQIATNAAALEALRQLYMKRSAMMDPTRRGDGLPLSAMTVEWSRSPRNDHVRHHQPAPLGVPVAAAAAAPVAAASCAAAPAPPSPSYAAASPERSAYAAGAAPTRSLRSSMF